MTASFLEREKVHVLLVEDADSDAALLAHYLEGVDAESVRLSRVDKLSGAMPFVHDEKPDLIMLDLKLPDSDSLEGFDSIRSFAPMLPVLIITGRDDEKLAFKAVENGAQDYLLKNKLNPQMLRRCIHYAIRRKQFEDTILYQAHYDKLTGLPNRHMFNQRLAVSMARQRRHGGALALFLIDLNGFKAINDTLGHLAGDEVLSELGRRLTASIRPYDIAARLGGDEFVILIDSLQDMLYFRRIARKVLDVIEEPMEICDRTMAIGASIGVCVKEDRAPCDAEDMLRAADAAMYAIKKEGRSAFVFTTPEEGRKLHMN